MAESRLVNVAADGLSVATGLAGHAADGVIGSAMPMAAPILAGSMVMDTLTKGGSRGNSESSQSMGEQDPTTFLQQAKQDRRVFFYQTNELRQFIDASSRHLSRLHRDIVPYKGFNVIAPDQMGFFRRIFSRIELADSIVSVQHMDIETCHNHRGREYHHLFIRFLDGFKDSRAFIQSQAKMSDPRYFMILGLYNGMLLIHERFKDNAAERLVQLKIMLDFCDYIAQQSDLGLGKQTRLVEAVKSG